jgi:thioredoxin reductase
MARSSDSEFDAIVVGAGPAGLNAALMLGRARRRVALFDDGEPRNAVSHAMHGFLSRDGLDPAELRRIGHAQLARYDSVQLVPGGVDDAQTTGSGFRVITTRGRSIETRKLLLAVGLQDVLPEIEGLTALYGISVFHCFYCDGWEVRDQPVAALGEGTGGYRLAMMLLEWTHDLVLCTHGGAGLAAQERAHLTAQGIEINQQRIVRVETADGHLEQVVFEDGSSLARRALFFHGPVQLASSLPARLGCALTEQGRIEVDEGGRTSMPGVFAAGDAARRPGQHPSAQVILAAASGALAGIALHQELVHEDVGLTPALPRAEPTRAS